MKIKTIDAWIGFIAALCFASVMPIVYDALSARLPFLMDDLSTAAVFETIICLGLSLIVFVLYTQTAFYRKRHTSNGIRVSAAAIRFFIGNILGYCAIAFLVIFAVSEWRGPAL